jgi:hypothetical protein
MDDYNFYIILRPVDRFKTKFYRVWASFPAVRQLITERDCTGLTENQWIIERFTLRLDKNNAYVSIRCDGDDNQNLEIYEAAFNDKKFHRAPMGIDLFLYRGFQIDFRLSWT